MAKRKQEKVLPPDFQIAELANDCPQAAVVLVAYAYGDLDNGQKIRKMTIAGNGNDNLDVIPPDGTVEEWTRLLFDAYQDEDVETFRKATEWLRYVYESDIVKLLASLDVKYSFGPFTINDVMRVIHVNEEQETIQFSWVEEEHFGESDEDIGGTKKMYISDFIEQDFKEFFSWEGAMSCLVAEFTEAEEVPEPTLDELLGEDYEGEIDHTILRSLLAEEAEAKIPLILGQDLELDTLSGYFSETSKDSHWRLDALRQLREDIKDTTYGVFVSENIDGKQCPFEIGVGVFFGTKIIMRNYDIDKGGDGNYAQIGQGFDDLKEAEAMLDTITSAFKAVCEGPIQIEY